MKPTPDKILTISDDNLQEFAKNVIIDFYGNDTERQNAIKILDNLMFSDGTYDNCKIQIKKNISKYHLNIEKDLSEEEYNQLFEDFTVLSFEPVLAEKAINISLIHLDEDDLMKSTDKNDAQSKDKGIRYDLVD